MAIGKRVLAGCARGGRLGQQRETFWGEGSGKTDPRMVAGIKKRNSEGSGKGRPKRGGVEKERQRKDVQKKPKKCRGKGHKKN